MYELDDSLKEQDIPSSVNPFSEEYMFTLPEEQRRLLIMWDEHMKKVNTHPDNLNFDSDDEMKDDSPRVTVTKEEIESLRACGWED